ncbi:hypothetical protein ACJJTC_000790 [Scirpophaga incertulas]
MGIIKQVISASILHLSCLNLGLMFGWPSSTIILFMSEGTPLQRPMTSMEISLFSSLGCIGALVSNPVTGILLDKLGRKKCAMILASIGTLSWCLITMSSYVEVVLVAVLISGVCASMFLVVPVFVSEFSEESIRGTLTSGAVVFNGLGILISYLLGGLVNYKTLLYVCLAVSAGGAALLLFVKESPTLLLKKGLEEEAKKSIAFYRNCSVHSKLVLQELDKIKRALQLCVQEPVSPEEEKLNAESFKNQEKESAQHLSIWQFFKKSQSTRRALLLAMCMMSATIFQGMIIIQIYAKVLFTEAVPEEILSATWCSVLLATTAVISGLIAAYLTDLAGRRMLMISMSIASGTFCVMLGTQIHLHWGPSWITAPIIYLFCACFTCGAGTVPYVLLAELFLPEIKSVISMIVLEWTFLCSFVALFIFKPLVEALTLGPVFYIFATICYITAIFSFFFLPETKGLPVDAIQLLLVKQKNRNIV